MRFIRSTWQLQRGTAGQTSVQVDFRYEPNVREGETAIDVAANVTVTGLKPRGKYTLLRYIGTPVSRLLAAAH